MSKFNASADDKFGVAEIMGFVFERVENTVGKGENAGYQHFLLFLQCFQKASYPELLKVGTVVVEFMLKLCKTFLNQSIIYNIISCVTNPAC